MTDTAGSPAGMSPASPALLHFGTLGVKRKKGIEPRYFMLFEDRLEYYRSEKEAGKRVDPRGRVNLEDVVTLSVASDESGSFPIGMTIELEESSLEIAAISDDDLAPWLEVLPMVIPEEKILSIAHRPTPEAPGQDAASPTQRPVLEGLLGVERKGKITERYFVLTGDCLEYFETLTDRRAGADPRGRVMLADIEKIQVGKSGFSVSIVGEKKALEIRPSEASDQEIWLRAMGAMGAENVGDIDTLAEGEQGNPEGATGTAHSEALADAVRTDSPGGSRPGFPGVRGDEAGEAEHLLAEAAAKGEAAHDDARGAARDHAEARVDARGAANSHAEARGDAGGGPRAHLEARGDTRSDALVGLGGQARGDVDVPSERHPGDSPHRARDDASAVGGEALQGEALHAQLLGASRHIDASDGRVAAEAAVARRRGDERPAAAEMALPLAASGPASRRADEKATAAAPGSGRHVCEGLLQTTRKGRNEHRYFALREDVLEYYPTAEDFKDRKPPRRQVPLKDIQLYSRKARSFFFTFEDRSVELSAERPEDAERWATAFEAVGLEQRVAREVSGEGTFTPRTPRHEGLQIKQEEVEQSLEDPAGTDAVSSPEVADEALAQGDVKIVKRGKVQQRYFCIFMDRFEYYGAESEISAGVKPRCRGMVDDIATVGVQETTCTFSIVIAEKTIDVVVPGSDMSMWRDAWARTMGSKLAWLPPAEEAASEPESDRALSSPLNSARGPCGLTPTQGSTAPPSRSVSTTATPVATPRQAEELPPSGMVRWASTPRSTPAHGNPRTDARDAAGAKAPTEVPQDFGSHRTAIEIFYAGAVSLEAPRRTSSRKPKLQSRQLVLARYKEDGCWLHFDCHSSDEARGTDDEAGRERSLAIPVSAIRTFNFTDTGFAIGTSSQQQTVHSRAADRDLWVEAFRAMFNAETERQPHAGSERPSAEASPRGSEQQDQTPQESPRSRSAARSLSGGRPQDLTPRGSPRPARSPQGARASERHQDDSMDAGHAEEQLDMATTADSSAVSPSRNACSALSWPTGDLQQGRFVQWLAGLNANDPPLHNGLLGVNHNRRFVTGYFVLFKDRFDFWNRPLEAAEGRNPCGRILLSGVWSFETVSNGFILNYKGRKIGMHVRTNADLHEWSQALLSVLAPQDGVGAPASGKATSSSAGGLVPSKATSSSANTDTPRAPSPRRSKSADKPLRSLSNTKPRTEDSFKRLREQLRHCVGLVPPAQIKSFFDPEGAGARPVADVAQMLKNMLNPGEAGAASGTPSGDATRDVDLLVKALDSQSNGMVKTGDLVSMITDQRFFDQQATKMKKMRRGASWCPRVAELKKKVTVDPEETAQNAPLSARGRKRNYFEERSTGLGLIVNTSSNLRRDGGFNYSNYGVASKVGTSASERQLNTSSNKDAIADKVNSHRIIDKQPGPGACPWTKINHASQNTRADPETARRREAKADTKRESFDKIGGDEKHITRPCTMVTEKLTGTNRQAVVVRKQKDAWDIPAKVTDAGRSSMGWARPYEHSISDKMRPLTSNIQSRSKQ